jgi:alpha-L-arabinofuranosidase
MKTLVCSKPLAWLALPLALFSSSAIFAADAAPDAAAAPAAPGTPTITVNADLVKGKSSPMLYGIMTEEINYSYDGGLYGELLVNRSFKDDDQEPLYWSLVQDPGANGTIALDRSEMANTNLVTSLKLTATTASNTQRVGFANEGYWGIPVRPNTIYHASFYAKASGNFTGPITLAIAATDRPVTYATATVPAITDTWQKYEVTLTTGNVTPTKNANFLIWTTSPGTAWFSLVSLFPPTYNNRPNGNRIDIMQLLADLGPKFLRFPGGNYLEGNTIATRFNWKNTLGDISLRPGHMDDAWRYRSSDGMGLLEYLEWCEDLHMSPLLAVYAGYSLMGEKVAAGQDLQPYVQDALDEIEYVTGDTSTTWGAQRAKDGHPEPFKLTYVEIGNEDNLERGTKTYEDRFAQIYDAIKAKYPNLLLICSGGRVKSRTPDAFDDHFYRNANQMESDTHHYDNTDRDGPKIFVGEWATREGSPTPNLNAALGDAAWLTGLERNSDVVVMASYAPLFVNVNPGGMQWPTDLIGYDALTSYGSPSYYVQKMFNNNRGDDILSVNYSDIPSRTWTPPAGRRGGAPAAPQQVPILFFDATRDSKSGEIYLKLVNTSGTPEPVHINISGAASVQANGESTILQGDSPTETNSITQPNNIVPVTAPETGLGPSFDRTLPPYSITVLKLQTS